MSLDLSPEQQNFVLGDGAAQDARHEARASINAGDRTFVLAGGSLYKIGPEPAAGQRFGLGHGGTRWLITWPDGAEQKTRNLWHWGETTLPDNAMLQQEPFWGNNLRVEDREHLLGPVPLNLRATYDKYFPYGFFSIIEERESRHVRAARERAQRDAAYDSNPLLRLVQYRAGGWRHKVLWGRVQLVVMRFVNRRIICTKCWHLPNIHWRVGDDVTGPIDWGCGAHHVDKKTGKHIHCDC